MRVWIFALAIMLSDSAAAQNAHPPGEESDLHDRFYSTWLRPNMREYDKRYLSCCSKEDCRPTKVKQEGGTWFAWFREQDRWVVVPDMVVEQNYPDAVESPDGLNHACISPYTGQVFCVVLGSMI